MLNLSLNFELPQNIRSTSAEHWPRQRLGDYGLLTAQVATSGHLASMYLEFSPGVGPQPDENGNHTPEQLQEMATIHEAASAKMLEFVNADGTLAWEYRATDPSHLRIYAQPGLPPDLVRRYCAKRAPVEYNWGFLGMVYTVTCDHDDKGLKSNKAWFDGTGVEICGLDYTYTSTPSSLTLTETPYWRTNGGTKVQGTPVTKTLTGRAWLDYRDAARADIRQSLKMWVPMALMALGVAGTVAEARDVARAWLAGPINTGLDFYVTTGEGSELTQSIADSVDTHQWLLSVIPTGVIPGLLEGKTVQEMIAEALL